MGEGNSQLTLDGLVRTLRREASVDGHGSEGRIAKALSERREVVASSPILPSEVLRQSSFVPVTVQ